MKEEIDKINRQWDNDFKPNPVFRVSPLYRNKIKRWWSEKLEMQYLKGRQSVFDEIKHEQNKLLDGFAHPKDCNMCKQNAN